MLRILTLILLSVLFLGCRHNDNRLVHRGSSIVFTSERRPYISDTLELFGGKMTLLNHLPAIQTIASGQVIDYDDDSLVLRGIDDYAILRVRINTLEQWDILVRAGDTLNCRYESGLPAFTLSRQSATYADVNYNSLKRKRYLQGKFMVDTEYKDLTLVYLLNNPNYTTMPSLSALKQSAKVRYALQLTDESQWLDSFQRVDMLNCIAYRFYKSLNRYQRLHLELDDKPRNELRHIITTYCDSTYRNDHYLFYRAYYDAVVRKYYYNKMIQLSNGVDYDFKDTYRHLEQDTILRGELRDVHLSQCFRKIDELFSVDDAKLYYDKTVKTITDTVILNSLHRDYDKLYAHKIQYSNDLALQNRKGVATTLQKVIAANRGKVVYVDFWASWCVPCMEGMPASKQLRNDYKSKDVVFVYLAFNDKDAAWRGAIPKAELDRVEHNYLVTNPRTSAMVEKLKLKTIPRYLLYDKSGHLVNENAPRPESKEIRSQLNKYL